MTRANGSLAGALASLLAAAGCGLPEPAPMVRIIGASPEGEQVPVDLGAAEIRFSAPVSPDGLTGGERLVLVPEPLVRAALEAVESDAGAAALEGTVSASVVLDPSGTRALLRPAAVLRARTAHALVLSSRVRGASGGAVLDPEGRRGPFVARFTTGAPLGPPPRPVLAEVRADAATPEAGGEWVELANLGEGPLELAGLRLAKRSPAGSLSSCALASGAGEAIAPGGIALVVGGAYDGRYALPPETLLVRCGSAGLLGGIANDRAPELLLLDSSGAVLATLGKGGAAPPCPGLTLALVDPFAPDGPGNLACGTEEGTPGEL